MLLCAKQQSKKLQENAGSWNMYKGSENNLRPQRFIESEGCTKKKIINHTCPCVMRSLCRTQKQKEKSANWEGLQDFEIKTTTEQTEWLCSGKTTS